MSDDKAMRTFKVLTGIQGDTGIYKTEAIVRDGVWWLVESWMDNRRDGYCIPSRVIMLGSPPHQQLDAPAYGASWAITEPIPREVAECRVPEGQEGEYLVLEQPDWRFPLPKEQLS